MIFSDDFEDGVIDAGWIEADPSNHATWSEGNGMLSVVTTSGGDAYNAPAANSRMLQVHDDGDFDIAAKFVAPVNEVGLGLWADNGTDDEYLRYDIRLTSSQYWSFAADRTSGGAYNFYSNEYIRSVGEIFTAGMWVRLARVGTTVTCYYRDGDADPWTELVSWASPIAANRVGLQVVGTNAADESVYLFENLAAPAPGTGSGTAVGTFSWTGTASGSRPSQGSAVGEFSWGPQKPIDTEFDTLPERWTFDPGPNTPATLEMAEGFAAITLPAGVNFDGISGPTGDDLTAGLVTSQADEDFDIAVRLGTDIKGAGGPSFEFAITGVDDTEMIRWAIYSSQIDAGKYGYARAGGTGTNFQAAAILAGNFNGGHGAWMRVQRVGDVFTFYTSADGATWTAESQVTHAIAVSSLKLAVGQSSTMPGGTYRYDAVVDLLAKGGTDARGPVPTYYQSATQATEFDTAPSWLALADANNGSAVITGGNLELSIDATVDSYARAYGTIGQHPNAGVLARFRFTSDPASQYAIVGLGIDDGGPSIDQYSQGPGYIAEINGQSGDVRVLRVQRPADNDTFEEPYTFLLEANDPFPGQQSWTWWRIERFGSRIRFRWWLDGTAEPDTWNFDAEDDCLDAQGALTPYLALAHSNGGAGSIQVDSLESYELSEQSPVNSGSAVGEFAWSGQASGATSHSGSASGTVTWTGTASGTSARSGSAVGTFAWDGQASGTAPAVGAASGSAVGTFTWDGQASGSRISQGSAVAGYAWTGSASGTGTRDKRNLRITDFTPPDTDLATTGPVTDLRTTGPLPSSHVAGKPASPTKTPEPTL